jgi:hypothetical protein
MRYELLPQQRRLTLRSTGEPTAHRQPRAGGTPYIFTGPGLAVCRRLPVTSNVRPQNNPSVAGETGSRFGKLTHGRPERTTWPQIHRRAHLMHIPNELRVTPAVETVCGRRLQGIACGHQHGATRSACQGQLVEYASRKRAAPRKVFVGLAGSVELAFGYRATICVAGSRLSRVASGLSKPGPAAVARSASSAVASQRFAFTGQLRPNPSFNRRANGTPPGPVWRYAVHFRQPGPGGAPLPPG